MSEREIKPGSKWRNVHGEVEVLSVMDRANPPLVCINRVSGALAVSHFLATHVWVSDPVETPKVGSWVEDVDGPRVVVVKNEKSNPFCAIPQYLLHPDKVGNEYTPCDPPPLVKALDVLADTHPGDEFEWRHVQAVMTEWRALKAKMGVE